jgi:hypothetical protein
MEIDSARAARIDAIIESIGSGAYTVDELDVADAILARWRRIDVLEPPQSDRPAPDQSTDTATESEPSNR